MTITLKESLRGTVLSLIMPCVLFCLLAGCTTVQPIAAELQRLQGTWEGDEVTITITGNSFHFYRDTNFWFETTITLPAGTGPQQLRATIKRCPPSQSNSIGEVVPAIFKIEDGTLTLAAFQDHEAEPPKSFEDKEAMRYELRKVQRQKKNAEATTSK